MKYYSSIGQTVSDQLGGSGKMVISHPMADQLKRNDFCNENIPPYSVMMQATRVFYDFQAFHFTVF
jgi:hypothetical protein